MGRGNRGSSTPSEGLWPLVAARFARAGCAVRPPQPPPGGAEMIWLTWRQFRAQAVTAAAALAAFAVLLAVTGPHLASLYTASGITSCHSGSCGQLASSFLSQVGAGLYPAVYVLGIAGIVQIGRASGKER